MLVPGLQISEHFPRIAGHADKLAIASSQQSRMTLYATLEQSDPEGNHSLAVLPSLTAVP